MIVNRIEATKFISTANLEQNIVNRKMYTNEKVSWLKTKEILLKKQHPCSIFMKESFAEDFRQIDIKKRTQGRLSLLRSSSFTILWPNGKEISKSKLKDLKSLMQFIPKDSQWLYKNFIASEDIVDDVEGFSGNPDFDIDFENEENQED